MTVRIHDHNTLQHRTKCDGLLMYGEGVELVLANECIGIRTERSDLRTVVEEESTQIGSDKKARIVERLYASHLVATKYIRAVYAVHARAAEQVQSVVCTDIDSTAYLFGAEDAAIRLHCPDICQCNAVWQCTYNNLVSREEVHLPAYDLNVPHLTERRVYIPDK